MNKHSTIATVERDSRETVEREDNSKKDVRVEIKNAKPNKKLAEYRKKKAYDTDRHVQYLKDELEDSREKANCLQLEVVNHQGFKRSVELRAGSLDKEILDIKVEMRVRICLSSVLH